MLKDDSVAPALQAQKEALEKARVEVRVLPLNQGLQHQTHCIRILWRGRLGTDQRRRTCRIGVNFGIMNHNELANDDVEGVLKDDSVAPALQAQKEALEKARVEVWCEDTIPLILNLHSPYPGRVAEESRKPT